MKFVLLVLFLTKSIHTYGFSLYAPEDCMDFTVGDCTITEDSIINEFPAEDASMCQEVCRQLSSCMLFSFDGTICFLLKKEYRKGCGDVGAPVDVDMDHCQDSLVESCSGFDEENCEYLGESVGVDPPNGEVSDPLVCQNLCETLGFMGCTFWVYKDEEQSCQLVKSSARRCAGISGPRAPPIEDCGFMVSTTTHQPATTTQNQNDFKNGACYEDCINGRQIMAGCGRILEGFLERYDQITVEKCIAICQDKGFAFAGLEYGSWCGCGNEVPAGYRKPGECKMACDGDSGQICGDYKRINIYRTKGCSIGSEFMGSCYELVKTALSWDDASRDCSSRGGALASIPNEDVNSFLTTLTTSNAWVGGSDVAEEGVWVWPNGDQLTYTNWGGGLPDNCDNCGQDCMMLNYIETGFWDDRGCFAGLQYICEFPISVVE